MKKFFKTLAVAAFALSAAVSCNKTQQPEEPTNPTDKVSAEEQQRRKKVEATLSYLKNDIMMDYYFWYDQVPDVSFNYQTDIYDFFDSMLVSNDRWSWMIDGPTYVADETGVVYGTFGASLSQMSDYNIAVRYVYPGSPFADAGVQRGWVIDSLDGKPVLTYWLGTKKSVEKLNEILFSPSTTEAHSFVFKDVEGGSLECEITAAESLITRPCLQKKIFTEADYPGLKEPVGYFHYLGFKADEDADGKSMLADIAEPMEYFASEGVKTLIVDLRYNGGGDSRASDTLVSYLAPAKADGQVYVKRTHNRKLSAYDMEQKVHLAQNHPGFEHLYFITGSGSASASEMVLNGLKPLADVHHVGQVTYGKPNGMYVFFYPESLKAYDRGDYSSLEYVFLPICFYNTNGEGTYIPDTGIVPDEELDDDLLHDFGPEEANIAACLHHIVNGTYPEKTKAIRKAATGTAGQTPLRVSLEEERRDANWGKYTVRPDFR